MPILSLIFTAVMKIPKQKSMVVMASKTVAIIISFTRLKLMTNMGLPHFIFKFDLSGWPFRQLRMMRSPQHNIF